ncbi:hypothetical protein [Kiloniella sp. b19]|uniref:hypothetical protein n=1 Tax=Kiloniella sp. GXU_MW_B19 TaxID=3141326 RepID=UPI0031D16E8D
MHKFLFENSFEDGLFGEPTAPGKPASAQAPSEPAPEEQEEEIAPGYSEEELQSACQESFGNGLSQGMEEGRVSALQSIESQINQTTAAIAQTLPALFQTMEQERDKLLGDTRFLILTILKKLLPTLEQSRAQAEVERIVAESILRLPNEPRIAIRIHPDLCEAMNPVLDNLTKQAGFEGKLIVLPDPEKALSDVAVEWADGGAERNLSDIQEKVFELIDSTFPATPEQNTITPPAETEPPSETSSSQDEAMIDNGEQQ